MEGEGGRVEYLFSLFRGISMGHYYHYFIIIIIPVIITFLNTTYGNILIILPLIHYFHYQHYK